MLPSPAPDDEPATAAKRPRWFLADVVAPFVASRAVLLLAAWWAVQFAPSWNYFLPAAATRGWAYLPSLPLDVWGRYDTTWYLDLAWNGYRLPDSPEWQSNLAFFPLYPIVVRAAYALVPSSWHGWPTFYLCGVAVANAAALGGLAAVHAWVRTVTADAALARRTVLLLLLFPTGYFLSCAYSESLFLLLSASSLLALARGRVAAAGAAGLLAALTRPSGVLLAVPIAMAGLSRRWPATAPAPPAAAPRASSVRVGLAAALPPLGLLLHAVNLARLTGDPLAFAHAQAAWGRTLSAPWALFLPSPGLHPWMAWLDRAAILLFVGLALALLRERRREVAAYALLSLAPVLLSGTPMSASRILLVVFPAFLPLARLAQDERVSCATAVLFASLQALMFASWSRFYWAG